MNKRNKRPINKVPLMMLAVLVGLTVFLGIRIHAMDTQQAEPTPPVNSNH